MNPRQRQQLYTGYILALTGITILHMVRQDWTVAALGAVLTASMAWHLRQWLLPGLWSWLDGRGWHWTNEPATAPRGEAP